MSSDAPASQNFFDQGNSFLVTFTSAPNFWGFVGFYRCDKPRGEGTGLLGPATAAKEEAAIAHELRVTRVLKDWQISIKFKCADLAAVFKPFCALIAEHILKDMLS